MSGPMATHQLSRWKSLSSLACLPADNRLLARARAKVIARTAMASIGECSWARLDGTGRWGYCRVGERALIPSSCACVLFAQLQILLCRREKESSCSAFLPPKSRILRRSLRRCRSLPPHRRLLQTPVRKAPTQRPASDGRTVHSVLRLL